MQFLRQIPGGGVLIASGVRRGRAGGYREGMLTRLYVDGFKNLRQLDVQFGPLTCIAGPNGVGKSNLFDAIQFLSALAGAPMLDAAHSVRGGDPRVGPVRSLFSRCGSVVGTDMHFIAEMLIPESGMDELGQLARASGTHLRYELRLRHRQDEIPEIGMFEVVYESMVRLKTSESPALLPFRQTKEWFRSVVLGTRAGPYISTNEDGGLRKVLIHSDTVGARGGGRPRPLPAATMPRTALSSVNNAAEHRTLVLAKREMLAWTQLQLEPSALRKTDHFTAPRVMAANGEHLPAFLFDLGQREERSAPTSQAAGASKDPSLLGAEGSRDRENLYARVANRLSEFVDGISKIDVDLDHRRQQFSIIVTDRSKTDYSAGVVSDGTLRFLALAVMAEDPKARGVVCLEEPENGVHPVRIEAMVHLLMDLAVDPTEPVGSDNPLRQVIFNTHSPVVVTVVPDDSLLMAVEEYTVEDHRRQTRLGLRHLAGTWRARAGNANEVARGDLLAYLNALGPPMEATPRQTESIRARVVDRPDVRQLLLSFGAE